MTDKEINTAESGVWANGELGEVESVALIAALREAQEAAEDYHAAWQDAAVWWKEKVERLEEAVQLGEGHYLTLQREAEVTRERDRLREALKRYGAHEFGCLPYDPCSCGLSDLVA